MDEPTAIIEAVKSLWPVLSGQHGILPAIFTWIGIIKPAILPFANWMQSFITSGLMLAAQSPELDDDSIVDKVLRHRAWRVSAFLIKWFTSFKLPSTESWEAMKASIKAAR